MKKPAAPWKPVPVAVQIAQHKAALARQHHHVKPRHHAKAVKKAKAHHHKKRAWTPDGDVPLCSARAVAESLRLALGVVLGDGDVLALHEAAGGTRDAGTSIPAVLMAVAHRSRSILVADLAPHADDYAPVPDADKRLGRGLVQDHAFAQVTPDEGVERQGLAFFDLMPLGDRLGDRLAAIQPSDFPAPAGEHGDVGAEGDFVVVQLCRDVLAQVEGANAHPASVILGVDWPEPHAVVACGGAWWSWGEPYEPWTDDISEAWSVQWRP